MRRDGSTIHVLRLSELGERSYWFRRRHDQTDIAGALIVNNDPQGIAMDNLRFEREQVIGWLAD